MTAAELAKHLVGDPVQEEQQTSLPVQRRRDPSKVDPKIKVLADRLALQVFSVPSLQAHLADYSVVPTGKPDGSVRIQMDFLKLPKEVLPDLERLLSVAYFKNHRLVKYVKDSQARTGLEIEVEPSELPGNAYDYAY